MTRFTSYPHRFTKSIAKPEWAVVKTETDAFQDQYYPAVHLNGAGAGALFHDKDRKHLPFLTNHNNGCQPFTVTTTASSESSESATRNAFSPATLASGIRTAPLF